MNPQIIYALLAILLYLILGFLVIIVLMPIMNIFNHSQGRKRVVAGEVFKDIGIALLVGSAFKWQLLEPSFWIVSIIGGLLVGVGAIMKIDNK